MKNWKTSGWKTMVQEWRKEQLLRAHLACSCQFVSPLPATSPKYCVGTIGKQTTVMTVMSLRQPNQFSSALPGLLATPWGPSMEVRQLGHKAEAGQRLSSQRGV